MSRMSQFRMSARQETAKKEEVNIFAMMAALSDSPSSSASRRRGSNSEFTSPASTPRSTHEKIEEGQVKKEKRFPWQQADDSGPNRIVGWENNAGVSQATAREAMLKDKSLRHEMKMLQKFLGDEGFSAVSEPVAREDSTEGQQRGKKRGRPPAAEKTPAMPLAWKAWYGTMPHLDSKQAYKLHLREEERLAKIRRAEEERQNECDKDRLTSMDLNALNAEMKKARQDVAEEEALCKELEIQIAKAERLDKEEELKASQVSKRLQKVSYKHGVMEGKLRSSETFFEQFYADTTEDYARKKLTLSKSYQLMLQELAGLKKEVGGLLQEAIDQKEQQASNGQSAEASKPSKRA